MADKDFLAGIDWGEDNKPEVANPVVKPPKDDFLAGIDWGEEEEVKPPAPKPPPSTDLAELAVQEEDILPGGEFVPAKDFPVPVADLENYDLERWQQAGGYIDELPKYRKNAPNPRAEEIQKAIETKDFLFKDFAKLPWEQEEVTPTQRKVMDAIQKHEFYGKGGTGKLPADAILKDIEKDIPEAANWDRKKFAQGVVPMRKHLAELRDPFRLAIETATIKQSDNKDMTPVYKKLLNLDKNQLEAYYMFVERLRNSGDQKLKGGYNDIWGASPLWDILRRNFAADKEGKVDEQKLTFLENLTLGLADSAVDTGVSLAAFADPRKMTSAQRAAIRAKLAAESADTGKASLTPEAIDAFWKKLERARVGAKNAEKRMHDVETSFTSSMGKWLGQGAQDATKMVVPMILTMGITAATGGAGAPALLALAGETASLGMWAGVMQQDSYEDMVRSGINPNDASAWSYITAPYLAAVEMAQIKGFTPNLRKGLNLSLGKALTEFAKRSTKSYAYENLEEFIQDGGQLIAKHAAAYLDQNAPELDTGKDISDFIASRGRVAASMLFLMGASVGSDLINLRVASNKIDMLDKNGGKINFIREKDGTWTMVTAKGTRDHITEPDYIKQLENARLQQAAGDKLDELLDNPQDIARQAGVKSKKVRKLVAEGVAAGERLTRGEGDRVDLDRIYAEINETGSVGDAAIAEALINTVDPDVEAAVDFRTQETESEPVTEEQQAAEEAVAEETPAVPSVEEARRYFKDRAADDADLSAVDSIPDDVIIEMYRAETAQDAEANVDRETIKAEVINRAQEELKAERRKTLEKDLKKAISDGNEKEIDRIATEIAQLEQETENDQEVERKVQSVQQEKTEPETGRTLPNESTGGEEGTPGKLLEKPKEKVAGAEEVDAFVEPPADATRKLKVAKEGKKPAEAVNTPEFKKTEAKAKKLAESKKAPEPEVKRKTAKAKTLKEKAKAKKKVPRAKQKKATKVEKAEKSATVTNTTKEKTNGRVHEPTTRRRAEHLPGNRAEGRRLLGTLRKRLSNRSTASGSKAGIEIGNSLEYIGAEGVKGDAEWDAVLADAAKFGGKVKIVILKQAKNIKRKIGGMYVDNTIYLVKADSYKHEKFHWLVKDGNKQAIESIDNIKRTGKVWDWYKKRWTKLTGDSNLTDARIAEEIAADVYKGKLKNNFKIKDALVSDIFAPATTATEAEAKKKKTPEKKKAPPVAVEVGEDMGPAIKKLTAELNEGALVASKAELADLKKELQKTLATNLWGFEGDGPFKFDKLKRTEKDGIVTYVGQAPNGRWGAVSLTTAADKKTGVPGLTYFRKQYDSRESAQKAADAEAADRRAAKADVLDSESFYDYYSDYDYVLKTTIREFNDSQKGDTQKWAVIPAARVIKIWNDFAKQGIVKDEKGVDRIAQQVIKNIQQVHANTVLAGHTIEDPDELVEDMKLEKTDDHDFGDYILDDNGRLRISDYAMDDLVGDAVELMAANTAEDKLQIIDRIFNRIHRRSDIAGWFIEGGQDTLNKLAGTDTGVSFDIDTASESELKDKAKDLKVKVAPGKYTMAQVDALKEKVIAAMKKKAAAKAPALKETEEFFEDYTALRKERNRLNNRIKKLRAAKSKSVDELGVMIREAHNVMARLIPRNTPEYARFMKQLAPNLAKRKTTKGRMTYLNKLMTKIDEALLKREQKTIINDIYRMIKNSEPKNKKGVSVGKLTPETDAYLAEFKRLMDMEYAPETDPVTGEEVRVPGVTYRVDELKALEARETSTKQDKDGNFVDEMTAEDYATLGILRALEDLDNQNIEDLNKLRDRIDTIITGAKLEHQQKEADRLTKQHDLRDLGVKESLGGKKLKTQDELEEVLPLGPKRTWEFLHRTSGKLLSPVSFFSTLLDYATNRSGAGAMKGLFTQHMRKSAQKADDAEFEIQEELNKDIDAARIQIFGNKLKAKKASRQGDVQVNDTGVFRDYTDYWEQTLEFYEKKLDAQQARANEPLSERQQRAIEKTKANIEAARKGLADAENTKPAKAIPLSQNKAYRFWQQWQNPEAREKMRQHGWGQSTIDQLEKFIKPEFMKWAQWQMDVLYPKIGDIVDKVHQRMFHTSLHRMENYTPAVYDRGGVHSDDALRLMADMLAGEGVGSAALPGAIKGRVAHSLAPSFVSGDYVLAKHIQDMSHFAAWAETIREMRGVLRNIEMKKAIIQSTDSSTYNALLSFVEFFAKNGSAAERTAWDGTFRMSRSLIYLGGLGFKYVKLPIQQVASIITTSAKMGPRAYLKHWALAANEGTFKIGREIFENSPSLRKRFKKGWSRDAAMMTETLKGTPFRELMGDFNALAMRGIKLGDIGGVMGSVIPLYHQLREEYKDQGIPEPEAKKMAALDIELDFNDWQQSSQMMQQNQWQRGGPIQKLFTTYASNPTAYFNVGLTSLRHANNWEDVRKASMALAIMPSLFMWIGSGGYLDWRDWTTYARVMASLTGGIPVVRKIADWAIDKAGGDRPFDFTFIPAASQLKSYLNALDAIVNEDKTKFKTWEKIGRATPAATAFAHIRGFQELMKTHSKFSTRVKVLMAAGWSTYALRKLIESQKKEQLEARRAQWRKEHAQKK